MDARREPRDAADDTGREPGPSRWQETSRSGTPSLARHDRSSNRPVPEESLPRAPLNTQRPAINGRAGQSLADSIRASGRACGRTRGRSGSTAGLPASLDPTRSGSFRHAPRSFAHGESAARCLLPSAAPAPGPHHPILFPQIRYTTNRQFHGQQTRADPVPPPLPHAPGQSQAAIRGSPTTPTPKQSVGPVEPTPLNHRITCGAQADRSGRCTARGRPAGGNA
jgi:hypothetical protein